MTTPRLSVREEQMAVTRHRILEACGVLALRHGGLDDPTLFTYAKVAELAGVSERTVYRAFPTKNELMHAFLDERTLTRGEDIPTDANELAAFLRQICREWDEQFPHTDDDRSATSALEAAAAGERDVDAAEAHNSRARDEAIVGAIGSVLPPEVTPEQGRAIAGVIRLLVSLRSVAQTAGRFDLSLVEAGEAHAWAAETLINAMQREETAPWTTASATRS